MDNSADTVIKRNKLNDWVLRCVHTCEGQWTVMYCGLCHKRIHDHEKITSHLVCSKYNEDVGTAWDRLDVHLSCTAEKHTIDPTKTPIAMYTAHIHNRIKAGKILLCLMELDFPHDLSWTIAAIVLLLQ
jgi:hypothetical protein